MTIKSCLDTILNPFSAVIKIQKEFANDVLENVKKQRESFSKHNREMALRRQELHLDELEEKYKCCVCGAKGSSRDFEPPIVLVNAMTDAVTSASEVVAHKKRPRGVSGRVSFATTPTNEGAMASAPVSMTPSSARNDGDGDVEMLPVDGISTDVADAHNREDDNGAEAAYSARPPVVDPRAVRDLIQRAKREVVNAQKLKRLEEKHNKEGSYHKDKGLMRIHETDVEAFSRFFQKPVRGFLCMECHSSARKRLDVLTDEIQHVISRALVMFTRHQKGASALAGPTGSAAVPPPGEHALQSSGVDDTSLVLPDEDIITLRQLQNCGVCHRRRATYFARKNVLFLCQYCCAIDRYYRRHAVCINDEWMSGECCTLLQLFAKTLRGDDDHRARLSSATAEASVRNYQPTQPSLFHSDYNLFVSQHASLCSPIRYREVTPTFALNAQPDFSVLMEAQDPSYAAKNARVRAGARSTAVSLFQGMQLAPHVNLFEPEVPNANDNGGADTQACGPRFDDLLISSPQERSQARLLPGNNGVRSEVGPGKPTAAVNNHCLDNAVGEEGAVRALSPTNANRRSPVSLSSNDRSGSGGEALLSHRPPVSVWDPTAPSLRTSTPETVDSDGPADDEGEPAEAMEALLDQIISTATSVEFNGTPPSDATPQLREAALDDADDDDLR